MNESAIIAQSKQAYKQWGKQWAEQAKENSKHEMKHFVDFEHSGVGKAILCVANGYSTEKNIDIIKKNQGNVDIICCDKTLGHLLDNGIVPTFCLVCDANVDYEKYMEPWKNSLGETTLFINVCANPKWADNGNWKSKYFFVNKDVMQYEKEFIEISGCPNVIPAGTNVSNCMVILLTICDNSGRRNYFGYDQINLIGFDYFWLAGGSYYAFDKDGGGKSNYMRHLYTRSLGGDLGYTSNNLAFSCNWLKKYIDTFKLPVVQCTKDSILSLSMNGDLEKQMQYTYKKEDSNKVVNLNNALAGYKKLIKEIDLEIKKISFDHYKAVRASL